jgi:aminoglycoside phosphotransferase (APT) family kinase protein
MAGQKMHVDEVDTSVDLVRRLLATQFPRWAGLPIAPVPSAGTDHALYRLGNDMVVRLPRIDWAVGQAAREAQWLPRLAPSLPLAIPAPLAQGMPGAGYPWSWSIYQWLPGANATPDQVTDRQRAAQDLAEFILALQQIDPKDGLRCGLHHASRGEPLAMRDAATRAALTDLEGLIDTAAAAAAWEAALRAPAWSEPPVWIHGDLHAGNLLAYQGRLSAVIDFGCLSVGDPATDVMTAWLYLDADTRDLFRTALAVDDATWARGRGWALSVGLIALPYYRRSNPILASIALRAIDEVLADGFATVTSY